MHNSRHATYKLSNLEQNQSPYGSDPYAWYPNRRNHQRVAGVEENGIQEEVTGKMLHCFHFFKSELNCSLCLKPLFNIAIDQFKKF